MKYKVIVNLNRIPDSYHILDDFELAKQYHHKHGVDIEFVFSRVDVKAYYSTFNNQKQRWLITGADKLLQLDQTADVNVFVFNQAEWSTSSGSQYPLKPETPNGSCTLVPPQKPFMCIGAYSAEHTNGQTAIQIAHELMHSLVQNAQLDGVIIHDQMDTYHENDLRDLPDSNFMIQWALLSSYINFNTMPTYTYFKPSEVINLKPEFVTKLDKARGIAGVPFIISSGYRDPAHNQEVGGVKDSAHETGLAVDLVVKDSVSGGKILLALAQAGLTRFGFYKDGHIHVDMDLTKPHPCYWIA